MEAFERVASEDLSGAAAAARALVDDDRVHRDAYVDPAVYARELRTFWAHTWQYLAHASQVPNPGDVVTVDLAGRPLMLVRTGDGALRVLANRCAHKGTKLVDEERANVGRHFRCPYHAWTYTLDGAPLGVPLREGYEGTRPRVVRIGARPRGACATSRCTATSSSSSSATPARGSPTTSATRSRRSTTSPTARRSAGSRSRAACCARSCAATGRSTSRTSTTRCTRWRRTNRRSPRRARVWGERPADAAKPMAMEQILPFGAPYDFFDRMGARVYPNGHSVLGTKHSIHSGYGKLPDYEAAMHAAYGAARAQEILEHAPQNAVLYPSLAVKGSPQAMRVIRPLAVDRTLVEAWSFRAVGAPDVMLERTQTYNRLVFSPMSIVAHDDLHLFESIQQGLAGEGNPWVSLHRGHRSDEELQPVQDTNGTNELLMRNQFRAWARYMTIDEAAP